MTFSTAFDPFRAIPAAWRMVKAAPVAMLVGGILLAVLGTGGNGNFNFKSDESSWGSIWDLEPGMRGAAIAGLIAAVLAMVLVIGFLAWLLLCLVRVGMGGACERLLVSGDVGVGAVFQSRGLLGAMLFTTFLRGLLLFVSTIPIIVLVGVVLATVASFGPVDGPGSALGIGLFVAGLLVGFVGVAYVALGLYFAPMAVAVEGLGARAALERSWDLARGNRLQLIVYGIVLAIFTFLGIFACCVGVFVTGAIAEIAQYESYLRLVRSRDEQAGWQVS